MSLSLQKAAAVADVIPVPPTSESQKGPQPISGEATASKVMVESVRSLLTGFRTPNVKFFTYNVDKKELQGFKSDMPILRVVYEERVFFDTDKADLRQEALPVVKSIANTLRQQKQKIALFVAGHTDARGSEDYNQKLSIRRAEAVGTAIRREGSGSALIWRVGFGKSIPIRPNNSERNMGLNRRVEFLVASQAEVITAWIRIPKDFAKTMRVAPLRWSPISKPSQSVTPEPNQSTLKFQVLSLWISR